MRAPGFSDFVVAAVIEGALTLLLEPGRWTHGAQARTGDGRPTKPEADDAKSWCVCGAIRRASFMALRPSDEPSRLRALLLVEIAARHLSTLLMQDFGVPCPSRNATRHLIDWNDVVGRRQGDVILLFRRTLGLSQRTSRAA